MDPVPYVDDAGRVADFHALRHSFISHLANAGVHPSVAKTLARHSTITLTMDRYTKVARERETDALALLPDLDAREAEAARATGTDDARADLPPHLPDSVSVAERQVTQASARAKKPQGQKDQRNGPETAVSTASGPSKAW